jgi:hypothetical protein
MVVRVAGWYAVAQLVEALCYKRYKQTHYLHLLSNLKTQWNGQYKYKDGAVWVRSPTVSLEFFIDIILLAALRSWG